MQYIAYEELNLDSLAHSRRSLGHQHHLINLHLCLTWCSFPPLVAVLLHYPSPPPEALLFQPPQTPLAVAAYAVFDALLLNL